MTWEGLVEALARQSAEMDRLAREGAPGVPTPETLAFFVRLQRSMMGWKKETLAGFARVSLSTIERIERGEAVSVESLNRVAEALRQPPGAFTAPRIPATSEEALQRLEESAAPFAETVAVPVKPLRGHRQIADLARADLTIVDGSRIGDAYDADIDTLRAWLDLTSFILATEDKDSIIRTDAHPVKRHKLYDDVLTCVRNIERRGYAVALAGTYQIETGNMAMPEATAALLGFFPKLTDPAAINRQTLFAPARVNWAAAWSQFRGDDG
jgi:transcriptional regulator with XRE-family HTH domain